MKCTIVVSSISADWMKTACPLGYLDFTKHHLERIGDTIAVSLSNEVALYIINITGYQSVAAGL
jgi:hypothetical protein